MHIPKHRNDHKSVGKSLSVLECYNYQLAITVPAYSDQNSNTTREGFALLLCWLDNSIRYYSSEPFIPFSHPLLYLNCH